MKLTLDQIRLDGGTQPRHAIDSTVVAQYARDMRDGVKFDPIEAVHDGTHYWCWDGFHRCAAAVVARISEMEVHITQGTLEDAQWLSLGANKQHGLPRSNIDKRNAVRKALAHSRASQLSDHQIAAHVGVSQPFVSRIRKQLAATDNDYQSRVRTGRDGRTINTAHIGKTHSKKRRRRAVAISKNAYMPTLPESEPCPMIVVQFSPNNAQTAAATLVEFFPRSFVEALVRELTQHLSQTGETDDHTHTSERHAGTVRPCHGGDPRVGLSMVGGQYPKPCDQPGSC